MPFKLKLMTYLVPDLPLELFQTFQYYLEESLGIPTSLCVESRGNIPIIDRNPFLEGDADLVFLSSTSLLQLIDHVDNTSAEMLPVTAVHNHPKSGQKPVCFSEVIIQKSRKDIYKEMKDLKGCRYSYDHEGSVDGNLIMLAHLKELGYNANFFGHTLESGSNRQSVQMVLQGRADVAAINSVALDLYLRERPDLKDKLAILTSLGPLPPNPIAINAKLPDEMKKKLATVFLQMNTTEKWNLALQKFNIRGFVESDISIYDKEKSLRGKKLRTQPAYY